MSFPSFATGEVLTAADMNAVGLWLVKTQTIGTGVSSVTVTGAFSADYDNYLITVNNGVASSGGDLRLGLGASVTGYKSQIIYALYSSTVLGFTATTSQWNYAGSSSTNEVQALCYVNSPFLAKFTKLIASYANETAFVGGGGIHEVAASYTSFTIAPSVGTITGGTIRVYGIKN